MDSQRFRLVHDDEEGGWTAYDGDAVMFTVREHYGADETIRLFVDRVEEWFEHGDDVVVLLDVTEYGYDALIVPWSVVNP
ncbi:hypothetical protein CryarDRAFT_0190 [Cryptosporangium arvum DSM 44712]|uniref:Uncharacterized protein n=2 Tax=Cryptosporangium TaxID=65502 RepID=A0A010ZKI7_9ACTN|nr:hypothetical protein CryarDRAFT_0190 [Cryptosporangium arvum DSM 44712]